MYFSEESARLVETLNEGTGYTSVGLATWLLLVMAFLGRYKKTVYQLLIGQILALTLWSFLTAFVEIDRLEDRAGAKATAWGKGVAYCIFCLFGCAYPLLLGLPERRQVGFL